MRKGEYLEKAQQRVKARFKLAILTAIGSFLAGCLLLWQASVTEDDSSMDYGFYGFACIIGSGVAIKVAIKTKKGIQQGRRFGKRHEEFMEDMEHFPDEPVIDPER